MKRKQNRRADWEMNAIRGPIVFRPVPRLTTGDVIFMLQPSSWAFEGTRPLPCLRNAALVALSTTMRMPLTAALDILLEDWLAGRVTRQTRLGVVSPVVLDVARVAVQRYIRERPANSCPYLFVTERGTQAGRVNVERSFNAFGHQCSFSDQMLQTRLLEFFDDAFLGEIDRPAVAALAGKRVAPDCAPRPASALIAEAAADPGRLREVLERSHPLTGPAGRFLGPRGMRLAEDDRTVFRSTVTMPHFSPVVFTDPDCIALYNETWETKTGQRGKRIRLRRRHFPRLDDLRIAGKIDRKQIAFLFNIKRGAIITWERARRNALRPADKTAYEAEWAEKARKLWDARPGREKFRAFFERIVMESDFPLSHRWLLPVIFPRRH